MSEGQGFVYESGCRNLDGGFLEGSLNFDELGGISDGFIDNKGKGVW